MRLALALLGSLLLAGCADAQPTPTASAALIDIADGRALAEAPDASAWEAHAAVRAAMQAARDHWRGQDAPFVDELRVMAAAEGAFTRPEATQTAVLYLASTEPRCCPKMGVAVIEADELVYHTAFEGTFQRLRAVPDLDADGRDELALIGSFGMGGHNSTSLTLASFDAEGRLHDLGSMDLEENGCAAMREEAHATRLRATPGPTFYAQRYVGTCEGRWTASGDDEAVELYPPAESRAYTDLPVR